MQIIVGLVRPGFQDFRFNDLINQLWTFKFIANIFLFSFDLLSNGQNCVY